MASIATLEQSAAALTATVRAAAAALARVGAGELSAALADLDRAEHAARDRLARAAASARDCLARLQSSADDYALALDADLFGTPEPSEQYPHATCPPVVVEQAVTAAANGPVEPARQWPEAPLPEEAQGEADATTDAARDDDDGVGRLRPASAQGLANAARCDVIRTDDDTGDAAEMPADPAPAAPAPKQTRKRGRR